MTTDLLPVFVYGTLRNGLGNYQRILRGNTTHEEAATLAGATMHNAGGFPFVTPTGDGEVIGEVMHLTPETAERTMLRLDSLEGFFGDGNPANMYDRKVVQVRLADGTEVTAYTYLASPRSTISTRRMPTIPSGDWKAVRRGHLVG